MESFLFPKRMVHRMLNPVDWSVVVAGRWNRAILTPAGIVQRVFKESPDIPMVIEVPIDMLAPPKIGLNDVSVVADWSRLVISADKPLWKLLERSASLAINAINELPQTPLQAVAFNVGYASNVHLDELDCFVKNPLDNKFSDQRLNMESKTVIRSMQWLGGSVNLTVMRKFEGEPNSTNQFADQVLFNIERKSDKVEDHVAWLSTTMQTIRDLIKSVFEECFLIETDHYKEVTE